MAEEITLSSKSERGKADSQSEMGMACTWITKRAMAATGKLATAQTQFCPAESVPNGGVLFALPALIANGLIQNVKSYFSLSKGFYGITHILLTLGFMALCRVKNPEQLRKESPGEWGKILGLDRVPEAKTLRKKVKKISEGQIQEWGAELSKDWMREDPGMSGVLYVDGHVRVYHGKQTKLPRRYVSRQKLCMRGIVDYWVNDQMGRPFFVVSTPFSEGMISQLEETLIPRLKTDVPQPSEAELEKDKYKNRFIMVFDREGYSPDLFKRLWEQRIACQTYNKYPKENWPEEWFTDCSVKMIHETETIMKLAERGTRLSNGLWVREIRKITKTGHQTSVLSTDYKSHESQIGGHMFSRWTQENFFKYAIKNFDIDRLIGYEMEDVDETRMVVNPEYRKLEGSIRSEAGKLSRAQVEYAKIILKEPIELDVVANYELKKGELQETIKMREQELKYLKNKKKKINRHIRYPELPEEDKFKQPNQASKLFIDTIKMIAYRAETALVLALREFSSKPDELRTFLKGLFTTEINLIPDEKSKTLTICLHPLGTPGFNSMAAKLCEILNQTKTIYPETDLQLVYEILFDSSESGK